MSNEAKGVVIDGIEYRVGDVFNEGDISGAVVAGIGVDCVRYSHGLGTGTTSSHMTLVSRGPAWPKPAMKWGDGWAHPGDSVAGAEGDEVLTRALYVGGPNPITLITRGPAWLDYNWHKDDQPPVGTVHRCGWVRQHNGWGVDGQWAWHVDGSVSLTLGADPATINEAHAIWAAAQGPNSIEATPAPAHPMQPVALDKHGTARFRDNKIVRHLLDKGPHDLNALAVMDWPEGDYTQLMQLIGYSVGGFEELSSSPDDLVLDAKRAASVCAGEAQPPKVWTIDDDPADGETWGREGSKWSFGSDAAGWCMGGAWVDSWTWHEDGRVQGPVGSGVLGGYAHVGNAATLPEADRLVREHLATQDMIKRRAKMPAKGLEALAQEPAEPTWSSDFPEPGFCVVRQGEDGLPMLALSNPRGVDMPDNYLTQSEWDGYSWQHYPVPHDLPAEDPTLTLSRKVRACSTDTEGAAVLRCDGAAS